MPAASAVEAGLRDREAALYGTLRSLPSLVVAYSGGVDSAYLAWAATRVLGDRALCVTADSPSYPRRHHEMAVSIAKDFGLRHEIIRTSEFEQAAYRANAPDRCYHCKHELYVQLSRLAADRGIAVVADGSNADDRGDYRPGRRAAREYHVISPLDDANLSKDDIRALSHEAHLPTWDEPSSPCLSSRVPYFSEVTQEKLTAIERSEDALRALGFRVVRVRHHDDVARIEVAQEELARLLEPGLSQIVDAALREIGFRHVAVDLRGYQLGSLNAVLKLTPI
jgi:uncharacterized protein